MIPGTNCDRSQFMCRDMSCVEGNMRCDGKADCRDSSDELNCCESDNVT